MTEGRTLSGVIAASGCAPPCSGETHPEALSGGMPWYL